jgi:hypothetical protein
MNSRTRLSGSVAALLLTAAPSAYADDKAEQLSPSLERECALVYSAFHPAPERCLGDISTDRPHKTDGPGTVAAGHVQLESGIVAYEIERLRGPSDNAVGLGDNIYTLGLADNTPGVRHAALQVLHGVGSYGIRSRKFSPQENLVVRSKLNLLDGPFELTLVPTLAAPMRSNVKTEGGGFVFLGAELPGKLDWELNVGAVSESTAGRSRRHAVTTATTAITRPIAGPVSVWGEFYTDTATDAPAQINSSIDGGVLVLLSKNWQLDAGSYFGVKGQIAAATPFVGLSTRM